jgi:hypothetical protein
LIKLIKAKIKNLIKTIMNLNNKFKIIKKIEYMIKVLMSIIRDIIRADNSRKMNIILTYKELNLEVLISMNLIIISMGNQLLIITKVMSL